MKKENILLLATTALLLLIRKRNSSGKGISGRNGSIGRADDNRSTNDNPGFDEFVRRALENKMLHEAYILTVCDDTLEKLQGILGYIPDNVIIRSKDIRHIRNRHIDAKKFSKDEIPLTKKDLINIPAIINGSIEIIEDKNTTQERKPGERAVRFFNIDTSIIGLR